MTGGALFRNKSNGTILIAESITPKSEALFKDGRHSIMTDANELTYDKHRGIERTRTPT